MAELNALFPQENEETIREVLKESGGDTVLAASRLVQWDSEYSHFMFIFMGDLLLISLPLSDQLSSQINSSPVTFYLYSHGILIQFRVIKCKSKKIVKGKRIVQF